MKENVKWIIIDGPPGIGCPVNASLSGVDFVVIVNIDKSVSYRGIKNDIDLGKDVAKFYGGGGHPKASGSPVGDDIRSQLLDLIFSR